MIIARDDIEPERVDYTTLIRVEQLIHFALVDDKGKLERRLNLIKYESEAETMIEELLLMQPIMGFHSIPYTIEDMKQAIRFAVAKDDFNEGL